MNKTQLVDAIASATDLPKAKAAEVLDITLNEMTKALAKGDPIALVGFCTITVKQRAARMGRDPRTGKPLNIPASKVVGFKAGKALKDAVNGIS